MEDRKISVMKFSEDDVTRYTEVTSFNLRASWEMCLVLDYGFMKISSEEDHHQDTF